MSKYSRSSTRVDDPYAYLALQVIYQALKEVECYFNQEGTEEEIRSGYDALRWVRRFGKKFRLYSSVTHIPIEQFHQLCLHKINEAKGRAIERRRVLQKDRQSKMGRKTIIKVVPIKRLPRLTITVIPVKGV